MNCPLARTPDWAAGTSTGSCTIIAFMNKRSDRARLSVAQWELVGQFNDGAFEYPELNFEQVVEKILGAPFSNTATDREFKGEAKKVFDREREK
jgi:hypothetical protein